MVINIHRIKGNVSQKKASLLETLVNATRRIFVPEIKKAQPLRKRIRTAMIMY